MTKTCDLCGAPCEDKHPSITHCESCSILEYDPSDYEAAKRAVERVRQQAWEAGRAPLIAVLQECLDDVDLFDAMREPDESPQGSIAGRAREAIRALKPAKASGS